MLECEVRGWEGERIRESHLLLELDMETLVALREIVKTCLMSGSKCPLRGGGFRYTYHGGDFSMDRSGCGDG